MRFQNIKVNMQKIIIFLYISNHQVEFEIKNTVLFTLALLKVKYLGISQKTMYKISVRKSTKNSKSIIVGYFPKHPVEA
jgi:hypothetical protein